MLLGVGYRRGPLMSESGNPMKYVLGGVANVACGSFSTELGSLRHVRFTPDSDRTPDMLVVRFVPTTEVGHHSITSSAIESNPDERARPSNLAVFRFITSTNLVGCMIGKSAGLVPLRIRPV